MLSPSLAGARAEDVWALLRAQEFRPQPCRAPVTPALLGQTLAADARAAADFPPFDRAVMDGYAVRAADFSNGAARLRVAGLQRAGGPPSPRVDPGGCVQINTGARLPEGADAVVMVERSARDGDFVSLSDAPAPGQLIERHSALMHAGAALAPAGTRIGPGELAALIAAGVQDVEVFARPRVALLSTGDEVVSAGSDLEAGQIYDSNTVALAELVSRAGGAALAPRRAPDESALLRAELELGLSADLLCVVGGMSKGTHDLVPGLLEELRVEWLVTSLDLKPGKPTRIGRGPSGAWVIGLPGNPVSAAICFLLFGARILAGLHGRVIREPRWLRGIVQCELPGNGARPMFQPATWDVDDSGRPIVTPIRWRGSGDPFGLVGANALLVRPPGALPQSPGAEATFTPLDIPE